jgi:hypothetical protein
MDAPGEGAQLWFDGRRVGILFRTNPSSGKARIVVDGVVVKIVSLYSATSKPRVYKLDLSLAPGRHLVEVNWIRGRHAVSTGNDVAVDGIAYIAA